MLVIGVLNTWDLGGAKIAWRVDGWADGWMGEVKTERGSGEEDLDCEDEGAGGGEG